MSRAAGSVLHGGGHQRPLGVLDAAECPPTFGVAPGMVVGLIAGGEQAFLKAVEGAEDDRALGQSDLEAYGLNAKDVVIGIAASGRTPYVLGGLAYAKSVGCRTAAIACNTGSEIGRAADLAIEVEVGPRGPDWLHPAQVGHSAETDPQHDLDGVDGAHRQGVPEPDGPM